MKCFNIFENSTSPNKGECFETLLQKKNVTIKRIISSKEIDSEVMIQEEDEWFIMIEGRASMRIGSEEIVLKSGDYCFIEAQKIHQVLSVEEGSIWLAVYL